MNKSTPISQLPNINSQGSFINDQQRQMITQAQNAIQNSTLPQNTQLSSDIINDDDPTIQEVLSQFNGSKQDMPSNPNINYVQQNHLQQQQLLAQIQAQQQAQQAQQNYIENMTQMSMPMNQIVPTGSSISTEVFSNYMISITDDLKLVVLVFAIYIVVNFIPIENVISRYVALDKIPYNNIIIKAFFAAIIFMFLKKLILKST